MKMMLKESVRFLNRGQIGEGKIKKPTEDGE